MFSDLVRVVSNANANDRFFLRNENGHCIPITVSLKMNTKENPYKLVIQRSVDESQCMFFSYLFT